MEPGTQGAKSLEAKCHADSPNVAPPPHTPPPQPQRPPAHLVLPSPPQVPSSVAQDLRYRALGFSNLAADLPEVVSGLPPGVGWARGIDETGAQVELTGLFIAFERPESSTVNQIAVNSLAGRVAFASRIRNPDNKIATLASFGLFSFGKNGRSNEALLQVSDGWGM